MPKKGEYFKFKNHKRKMKLLFIISADFKSILVPEDNGKQNLEEFYTKKLSKTCLFQLWQYISMCWWSRFRQYLGKDAVNNFINSMNKESQSQIAVTWWKNIFSKKLGRLKKAIKILITLNI